MLNEKDNSVLAVVECKYCPFLLRFCKALGALLFIMWSGFLMLAMFWFPQNPSLWLKVGYVVAVVITCALGCAYEPEDKQ